MLILAHRGASGYAAENTLKAFTEAVRLGADGIELDVQLSADGKIVVFHDHSTDRLCAHQGEISSMSSKEINRLKVAGSEAIPLLIEVLQACPPQLLINIELKTFESALPVVRLLTDAINKGSYSYSQFIVSSFDWLALQQVRRQNENIRIGVLTETDIALAHSFAKFINAESIHCHYHLLNAENVTEMHNDGFDIFAWTVNEATDAAAIRNLRIKGIITDYPDRI